MENFKKLSIGVITLIVLSVLTVVLGYIGFDLVFPEYPFLRKLYYSFQLFTMESGDRFYEKGIDYSLMTRLMFNIARFLAIFTLIYTITLALVSVLKDKYLLTRVRRMSGHTILCGLGEVGNAIARNFENKRKLVIIEKETGNENLERLRQQGARIITGNAFDPEMLRKVGIRRASCLYALTGDDFGNLAIIKNARSILRDLPTGNPGLIIAANIASRNLKTAASQEMSNVADRVNCQLQRMLDRFYILADERKTKADAADNSNEVKNEFDRVKTALLNFDPAIPDKDSEFENTVKLFNINEIAARYIFRHYPPDRFSPVIQPGDPPVHIILLGYSQMGEEFIKLCFQNCHYINRKKTRITLLSVDADIAENKILTKHKNITELFKLDFIKLNPHHLTHGSLDQYDLSGATIIYVCSENDQYQASYSVKATELFSRDIPIIRWFTKDVMTGLAASIPANVHTVDILQAVANHENIIDEMPDYQAKATHHRWLKRAVHDYVKKVEDCITINKDIPRPKATLLPWHQLDEETRDDNRSVIEHNLIKLRTAGKLPESGNFINPGDAPVDLSFLKDRRFVEQLAEMEHRRWLANKYYYAWEYDAMRNDAARKHNNLVDYDDLDEGTKAYDIQQVYELEEVF
jgi:hypothetical protein